MTHDYSAGPQMRPWKGSYRAHSGPVHTICEHYTWTTPGDGTDMARVAGWHRSRGWLAPGYHYLVLESGRVQFGRPEDVQGAGARGNNDRVIHVAWAGGRKAGSQDGHDTRTPAQIKALDELYQAIRVRHPSVTRIVGHRDLTPTQCPGYDVQSWRSARPYKATDTSLPAADAESLRVRGGLATILRNLFALLFGGR